MKTLGFWLYGHASPSQVRYRAALRPDLPKRLDPVMISEFEAQELIFGIENKIGKIDIGGSFRCGDSHGNYHACSKYVPPEGDHQCR